MGHYRGYLPNQVECCERLADFHRSGYRRISLWQSVERKSLRFCVSFGLNLVRVVRMKHLPLPYTQMERHFCSTPISMIGAASQSANVPYTVP